MKHEIPAEAVEKMQRDGWPSRDEQEAYWLRKEAEECKRCDERGVEEYEESGGGTSYRPCDHDELSRTEATCDWFDHYMPRLSHEEIMDRMINDQMDRFEVDE